MRQELLEKIEKHLGLLPASHKELEEINQDQEVLDNASLMKDFMMAIEAHGNNALKEDMRSWDLELQAESPKKDQQGQRAPKDEEAPASIPKAVLEQYFAPNPSYEINMVAAMRGASLDLLFPANGFEWTQPITNFVFTDQLLEGSKYRIENNQSKVLQEGELYSDEEQKIEFNLSEQHPGRYYLKFFNDRDTKILCFFIQKDLLPE